MNKNSNINEQYEREVYDFLGPEIIREDSDTKAALSLEEQRKRLRDAQNINRGHPRKDEEREKLKQINASCFESTSEIFTSLSLRTGKTKRSLMEEAIRHLAKKYA